MPTFVMPWMLTWFIHEMGDPEQVGRAFDFFLCSHPLAPIYVSASVSVASTKPGR